MPALPGVFVGKACTSQLASSVSDSALKAPKPWSVTSYQRTTYSDTTKSSKAFRAVKRLTGLVLLSAVALEPAKVPGLWFAEGVDIRAGDGAPIHFRRQTSLASLYLIPGWQTQYQYFNASQSAVYERLRCFSKK